MNVFAVFAVSFFYEYLQVPISDFRRSLTRKRNPEVV
jgi:hypothetical protein